MHVKILSKTKTLLYGILVSIFLLSTGYVSIACSDIIPSPLETINIAPSKILPDTPETIKSQLEMVYGKYLLVNEGEIFGVTLKQKAKINPDWFAISIVTVDGQIYNIGDVSVIYPIQSISKPFVLGLALEDHGSETILQKIGVEATGLPYDAMIASHIRNVKLQNPMISAGAIATVSLVKGKNEQGKWERTKKMFEQYIGRAVKIDEAEYAEEVKYSKQSKALTYILYANDFLYSTYTDAEISPNEIMSRYLQGTSIEVNTVDLAVMGATLANWGINPITNQRAIEKKHVQSILATMLVSGMYDYAGSWLYLVGIPAKSGVNGGIIAIVPNRFCIAVFSPRLDLYGKSIRGTGVIKDLSEKWNLNIFSSENEIWKPFKLEFKSAEY